MKAAPPPPWSYIAKLIVLGDSATGKSSLTVRLCEGRFSPAHDVTIGVEFGSRIVPVGPPANASLGIGVAAAATTHAPNHEAEQKKMKLSLWDTAGQETYKSITRSYFRGASGALLVFDITRRSSFESVTTWLNDLRQIAEDGIVVILVGNKSDLAAPDNHSGGPNSGGPRSDSSHMPGPRPRAVTREEAEAWCRRENVVKYVETSAKSGEGVERAFLEVAERIYQNIEAGKYDLKDRRSGVKEYGFSAARDRAIGGPKTVNLTVSDAEKAAQGRVCC